MYYYLPIYVNNRRMHVLKLDRAADNRTLFTFLVNASDFYEVFSRPSEFIQLICDSEGEENVNLAKDVDYKLEINEEDLTMRYRHIDGVPVYNLRIYKGKGRNSVDKSLDKCFRFAGKLGDTTQDGGNPFMLNALRNQSRPKEYVLQFCYETDDQTYVGAIRICEYRGEEEVFKASLDFGSEASQIHKSTLLKDKNMNIRDAFIEMVSGASKTEDYWQGRKNDDFTLYKSIYHIHNKPDKTSFGDLPMNNGDKTFLQSLLLVTASTADLVLLPNLKLMEQLSDVLKPYTIDLSKGEFMGNVITDLSNRELNDGILRLILCNFLTVTMNSEGKKAYLHFILLVPNVYRQEKVHKLISGLYDDFNLLRKNDQFSRYKGIEVGIVSESDASFFGVRALVKTDDLPYEKGAYYMIIDAGKGTTDFSLLAQEGDDLACYTSLYRSGIPASGHILTYAFYDALRSYFYSLGLGSVFDKIMDDSVTHNATANILDFVSLLEQFKIDYVNLTEGNSMEADARNLKDTGNDNITYLNTFLKNVLKDRKLIPGMKKALDEKIEIMMTLIRGSIVAYAKKQGVVCNHVFLTGRAFMLQPFRDAVSTMLVNEGVVQSKKNIFYRGNLTKTMCTYGAMKVGEQSIVNKNSDMLGSPSLIEEGEIGFWRKIWRRICSKPNKPKPVGAEMSFDFFYDGLGLSNVRNATFSLSGEETLIGRGNLDDIHVYYTGDGYMWRHGNSCGRIESDGTLSVPEEYRERLTKESMFPFDLKSFGLDEAPKMYSAVHGSVPKSKTVAVEEQPKAEGAEVNQAGGISENDLDK